MVVASTGGRALWMADALIAAPYNAVGRSLAALGDKPNSGTPLPGYGRDMAFVGAMVGGLQVLLILRMMVAHFRSMESLMSELYAVPSRVSEGSPNPITNLDRYRETRDAAQADPDGFWLSVSRQRIAWRTPPTVGLEGSFHDIAAGPLKWFADGTLNVTESCLDRHLESRGDKVALLWEGDEPGDVRAITYRELHAEVCRASNAIKALGVGVGDRVIIYMGMVPEAAVAMLACARIGAIHSVVFGGFSAEAVRDRVHDCGATVVITQDEGLRGSRKIPLKATVDDALSGEHGVGKVLVYRRTGGDVGWVEGRDVWWHEAVSAASSSCPATELAAEDPLFILYTSGSTGKPKGLVHTCGGYITYTAYTHATVFDLREDDIYACVADVGWVTGHSYIVYGPLANGATSLMFESVPTYPDAGRYWDMVQRHKITIFYTAPTAIRALAAQGDDHVLRYERSSLRVLGTVGEPINPDAWRWYYDVVGGGRCNIVDTWWQTETGGIAIAPIAPATPTTPGSATLPMPGIMPRLVSPEGRLHVGPGEGLLCIGHPWRAPSGVTTTASFGPTSSNTRACISPATAVAVTTTATIGSPAGLTMCSMSAATAWVRPSSSRSWSARTPSPRPVWSASRIRSRGRGSTPTSSCSPARPGRRRSSRRSKRPSLIPCLA